MPQCINPEAESKSTGTTFTTPVPIDSNVDFV